MPISHHPDEAGLVGSAHLAPPWIFGAYDSLVAVDIGGSNIRAGIVELRQDKASDLSKARVWESNSGVMPMTSRVARRRSSGSARC